jgi:Tol biopolymer transport system component
MKKVKILTFILFIFCLAWTINAYSQTTDEHFNKARELLNIGKYTEAAEEFKLVSTLMPDGSNVEQNARYWVGQCYFRSGQFDEALSTFEKLIEEYPESAIIPVTQLMVGRVQQQKKSEKLRRAQRDTASEKGIIIDSKTGVKYTKTRAFTGKRDVVTQAAYQLGLSPNGKFLLWNKLVIPMDNGEPFDLVDMPASLGNWSPDGKKVIYRSGGGIWVISVSPETGRSTEPAKKLLDGGYQYEPWIGWSPDSKKIVFERKDKEGRGNICTLSVRDGTLTQITNDPIREWRPIWSPDGKTIAYNRGYELWVMPAEGGSSRKLIDNGSAYFWSPDSKWLFYLWHGKFRFFCLADGREFIWNAPNGVGRFISWSPDGKKMIFYRSSYDWKSALKVVSASGGPSFELARRTELRPYKQYWSPDSKMIVTQRENKDGDDILLIIPLAGGEPFLLELDVSVAGKPRPLDLSSDYKKLAFVVERSDEKEDLYVVPFSLKDGRTTGSAVLALSGWNKKHGKGFSWSPDGTKIAVSHEGNIWMVSPEGGEPVHVTVRKNPGEYRADPIWSPDGKMIKYRVYHSENNQFLRVIPASGSEDTILLDIPLASSRSLYEWSADGKDLLSSSREAISAISIADGKSRKFLDLKELSLNTWCLSSSPDRKTLAFIGYKASEDWHPDRYQIFLVPVEGGKFTELAADDPGEKYWLWWSPDGKWISYNSDGFVKTRPEGAIWEADFEQILTKLSD